MQVNVHVTGFAEKPGPYTVPYPCSDHELEKVCGGWGPLGDGARIHVIRFARAEGEQRFESSQKDEILQKNQLRKVGDQYVFEPNDVIYIPMRQDLGPR